MLTCVRGCKKFARVRGLCHMHYNQTLPLIQSGETTWEGQEKAGLSLPKNKRAQHRWNDRDKSPSLHPPG